MSSLPPDARICTVDPCLTKSLPAPRAPLDLLFHVQNGPERGSAPPVASSVKLLINFTDFVKQRDRSVDRRGLSSRRRRPGRQLRRTPSAGPAIRALSSSQRRLRLPAECVMKRFSLGAASPVTDPGPAAAENEPRHGHIVNWQITGR